MALRPWCSILNFDLAPLFNFVLIDFYVDLQQIALQRNQTNMIKVCHIAAFHTTKSPDDRKVSCCIFPTVHIPSH